MIFAGKSSPWHVEIFDPVTLVLKTLLWGAYIYGAAALLYCLIHGIQAARYGTEERDETNTLLLVVIAGSIVAVIVAILVCGGPFLLAGIAGIQQAALYIVATVVAGELAVRVAWAALETKPALKRSTLSWNAALGWVFLPPMVMLARGHSGWALVAAIMAVVPAVICLRRTFPEQPEAIDHNETLLPSIYGLPAMKHRRSVLFVAILAQAAVALAAVHWVLVASMLLVVGTAIVAWQGSAPKTSAKTKEARPRRQTQRLRVLCTAVLAFLVTIMMQRVWPSLGVIASAPEKAQAQEQEHNRKFVSVLLLPPSKKEQVALPKPSPPPQGLGRGRLAKPLIIPFNGPYWYFQPPQERPGKDAHMARGNPMEENIRSTGEEILLMEAHQELKEPIARSCCREIDVSLTNADTRPGKITVGIMLRNSLSSKEQPLMLPQQVLVSSEGTTIDESRGPVNEVLRFSIPQTSSTDSKETLQRFDEITVIFLPTGRMSTGSKVAVRQFTLLP